MSNLQKVVFGAASDGSQGDTSRMAFTKDNANVDILNAQAFLTSFATTLTAGQALTAAAHLGKRVNINVSTAQTFNLPSATSCGADGVILLRNLGTVAVTLAITSGSGDTISMTTLNGLETALFDTDGIHAWNVLVRGRGTSANETVNGNSTVIGNETVGGTLAVTGGTTLGNTLTFPDATVQQTAPGRKNLFHNPRFRINTRGAPASFTSGSAYAYFLDRWRVTVSGQTASFVVTNGYYSTVTCPAGGIEQVLEPTEVFGGTYVVNWGGTATCEYGAAGSATAVVKGGTITLAVGSTTQVRFKGGTLWLPQLNPGNYSPTFDSPADPDEIARCERYCRLAKIDIEASQIGTVNYIWTVPFPRMRAVPANGGVIGSPAYAGIVAPPTFVIAQDSIQATIQASGSGVVAWYVVNYTVLLTADL